MTLHNAIRAALLTAILAAQASSEIFERNRRLARCINFGNILEAPREGDWGLTLKEEYFRLAMEAGFRSVRLPIKWSTHASAQAPYAIDGAFFERVDWAIAQSLKNGLALIVNVHHYDEMITAPAAHKDRWIGFWKQIAERYKNQGQDVYFEILNEPNGTLTAPLWNEFLKEALAVIRPANPTRAVIVGPVDWNNFSRLKDLVIPAEDANVIVTFHYYSPFQFTHQGADWVVGADAWLGTTWQAKDEAAVLRDLQLAAAWGEANRRPIFLGEFGAYSKADQASRLRWTSFVARNAERLGISWAYWEFASGFGIYDPTANRWREDLKNALVGTPLSLPGGGPGMGRGAGSMRRLTLGLDFEGRPSAGLYFRGKSGNWTDLQGRPIDGDP